MSRRSRKLAVAWLAGILVAGLLATASAEIPKKINYQGRLTDEATDEPLAGPQDMTFRIYDASTEGTELWSEAQTVTPDTMGVISVILGVTNPIDISFDAPVWLEVQVETEVLSPRREIASVPYAFYAANCDSLGGYSSSSYSLADHHHDDRYVQQDSLSTSGAINSASNPVDWTRLKNVPAGLADGTDDSEGDGHSLDADDGDPVDVVYVDSTGSVGVGTTDPDERLHVVGTVKAAAHGDTARAVIGETTTSAYTVNYGGYFTATDGQGSGVYAEGAIYGVRAKGITAVFAVTDHPTGSGVHAISENGGTALGGYANGNYSTGVRGNSNGSISGRGVWGSAGYNGSGNHAIHGSATSYPNAYAGYFDGRVYVSGYLSKAGGGFVIDHPGDPENRILRHSFVESPEMLLIYKGRARLEEGVVTVELPGYFESLAHPEGREIVLTCVRGYSPLYLDGEIADGRFTVRSAEGGAEDQEFSWIVYGTRNDAWAQEHRLPVEEDKTSGGEFKTGEYLNPRAFGIEMNSEDPYSIRGPAE